MHVPEIASTRDPQDGRRGRSRSSRGNLSKRGPLHHRSLQLATSFFDLKTGDGREAAPITALSEHHTEGPHSVGAHSRTRPATGWAAPCCGSLQSTTKRSTLKKMQRAPSSDMFGRPTCLRDVFVGAPRGGPRHVADDVIEWKQWRQVHQSPCLGAGCALANDILKAFLAEPLSRCPMGRPREYVGDVALQIDAGDPEESAAQTEEALDSHEG